MGHVQGSYHKYSGRRMPLHLATSNGGISDHDLKELRLMSTKAYQSSFVRGLLSIQGRQAWGAMSKLCNMNVGEPSCRPLSHSSFASKLMENLWEVDSLYNDSPTTNNVKMNIKHTAPMEITKEPAAPVSGIVDCNVNVLVCANDAFAVNIPPIPVTSSEAPSPGEANAKFVMRGISEL